jgi:anti-sigma regulatory factor (Ser/Thr protein kinase)
MWLGGAENVDRPAYLEMSFFPNVELVSAVRRFVSTVYVRLVRDPEVAAQVALATHELLENAVRYSNDDVTCLRVEIDRDAGMLTITTKNRAGPDDVAAIQHAIASLKASADPFLYYQQMMRESAKRHEGSGLGLARVHAEADMDLSCSVEGDHVTVRARAPLSGQLEKGAEPR